MKQLFLCLLALLAVPSVAQQLSKSKTSHSSPETTVTGNPTHTPGIPQGIAVGGGTLPVQPYVCQ